MKAEILNPFISSLVKIFEKHIGAIAVIDPIYMRREYPYTTGDVAGIIGITGDINGQIILSMPLKVAEEIASRMLKQQKAQMIRAQEKSALSELMNLITGNALNGLANAGYACDLTPPELVTGKKMNVTAPEGMQTIVVPIDFHFGKIEMNIALLI